MKSSTPGCLACQIARFMLMPCQAGRRWFRPDFPLCIRTRGGRHLTSAHSPRYAVIGGGLAGVAVAWHLLQASSPTKPLSLDLIVQGEGLADGASGAAAGLLHPTSPRGKLMWRGDEAFLATRRLVDVAEAAGRKQIAWRQGVLRLAQTQRQDEQLRAAAETMPSARYVPASHLDAILAGLTEEASAGLGALLFSDGMALDTKGYLDGLWADTQRRARELGATWLGLWLVPGRSPYSSWVSVCDAPMLGVAGECVVPRHSLPCHACTHCSTSIPIPNRSSSCAKQAQRQCCMRTPLCMTWRS
uniref:FAD dependent oxidoreductase domain-containing protein n=1 Tax=Auxenochlorella protothecoides TaxID=3075 RepID=A0A1D1ZMK4_AUXPR